MRSCPFCFVDAMGFLHPTKKEIMSTKNHPGIYVPPPLIYAAFFFFSFLLQKICPLSKKWLHTTQAHIIGWVLILFYFLMAFMAVRQFIISKNTVVTIKPATSLQTSGIYVFTRNPVSVAGIFLQRTCCFFR